jgi:hypothetical protein
MLIAGVPAKVWRVAYWKLVSRENQAGTRLMLGACFRHCSSTAQALLKHCSSTAWSTAQALLGPWFKQCSRMREGYPCGGAHGQLMRRRQSLGAVTGGILEAKSVAGLG